MKLPKASALTIDAAAGCPVRRSVQRLDRPWTTNITRIAGTMMARKNSSCGFSAIASTSESRKQSLVTK